MKGLHNHPILQDVNLEENQVILQYSEICNHSTLKCASANSLCMYVTWLCMLQLLFVCIHYLTVHVCYLMHVYNLIVHFAAEFPVYALPHCAGYNLIMHVRSFHDMQPHSAGMQPNCHVHKLINLVSPSCMSATSVCMHETCIYAIISCMMITSFCMCIVCNNFIVHQWKWTCFYKQS